LLREQIHASVQPGPAGKSAGWPVKTTKASRQAEAPSSPAIQRDWRCSLSKAAGIALHWKLRWYS